MRVTLIDCTGYGMEDPARHAANLLLFTKNTRLEMDPHGMQSIALMDWPAVQRELDYMARTIPSSWEFLHYTFLVEGVTRAFTHQFVRTRTGSYAQQSMRVTPMTQFKYRTGSSIAASEMQVPWHHAMRFIQEVYDSMIRGGVSIEDARGILPTNISTNIVASFNLRTLCEMCRKRASSRTQDEYREVMELMRREVVIAHPFTALFFARTFDRVATELEVILRTLPEEKRTAAIKLLDQMRQD